MIRACKRRRFLFHQKPYRHASKLLGYFVRREPVSLLSMKKTTAVDNGCDPEDKELLYIVIKWFLKDKTVRENN